MRRIYVAVVGTVAGLVGVIGLHSPPSRSLLAARGADGSAGSAKASSAAKGSSRPGSAPPLGGSRSPAHTALSGSALGALERYGYGQLAVKVTVAGSRIISVAVPEIQVADSYSGSIASQVIPMLRSEVLSAQSARINGVSGATYTSEAYDMSLQSALDKLHFK